MFSPMQTGGSHARHPPLVTETKSAETSCRGVATWDSVHHSHLKAMPLHWRRPPRGVPRIAERKTEGRYDRRLGQSLVRPFVNTASVTDALWLADHSNRCLNATLSDDHSRQFRAALALIGGFHAYA
jgi:hypothetical protein